MFLFAEIPVRLGMAATDNERHQVYHRTKSPYTIALRDYGPCLGFTLSLISLEQYT